MPTEKDSQRKKSEVDESRQYSKFNDLAVAITFGLTGLTVVYLPDIAHKSIDWIVEGRVLGFILAAIGVVFTLLAAGELTNRSALRDWGMALLIGTISGALIIILSKYRVPTAASITLLAVLITFIFVGIYAVVSGFAELFDDPARRPGPTDAATHSNGDSSISAVSKAKKDLGWYERITLLIAIVSTIATLAAAVEPIVHP